MGYGIIIAIVLITLLVIYTYKVILVIAIGLYALIITVIGAYVCKIIYKLEDDKDS